MLAEVIVGKRLTHGEGQDGLAVELRGVEVVLDETELLAEFAVELRVEVVEREGELLIHLRLILLFGLDAVVVLMLDHPLDQLHGGVVLAAVAFALGFHHHLRDLEGRGAQVDLQQVVEAVRLEADRLGVVAQRRDDQRGQPLVVLQGEGSIVVGHCADGGMLEHHGDIGEGLAADRVAHDARGGRDVLGAKGGKTGYTL